MQAHERNLRAAMLVLAEHIGEGRRTQDDKLRDRNGLLALGGAIVTGLELEMTANLLANRMPYPPSMFERSTRRWLEIPQEEAGAGAPFVNLAAEYEAATGVPLSDLRMVALVLWARAIGPDGPRVARDHLDALGLGVTRTTAVLSLLGASVEDLVAEDGTPGIDGDYESSVFSRRPLVRLASGGLLVISPGLLLERALGWLPRWDLAHTGSQGKARRVESAQSALSPTSGTPPSGTRSRHLNTSQLPVRGAARSTTRGRCKQRSAPEAAMRTAQSAGQGAGSSRRSRRGQLLVRPPQGCQPTPCSMT